MAQAIRIGHGGGAGPGDEGEEGEMEARAHTFNESSQSLLDRHLKPTRVAGWLHRFSVKDDTWVRRWFCLEGDALTVAATPASSTPLDVLRLSDLASVRTVHRVEGGFELIPRRRICPRTVLRAASAEDASLWLFAFHKSAAAMVRALLAKEEGRDEPDPARRRHSIEGHLGVGALLAGLPELNNARTPLHSPPFAASPRSSNSGNSDNDNENNDDSRGLLFAFDDDEGEEGGAQGGNGLVWQDSFHLELPVGHRHDRDVALHALPMPLSPNAALHHAVHQVEMSHVTAAHASSQGVRAHMEDVSVVDAVALAALPACLVAVFDGHAGNEASNFAASIIPGLLRDEDCSSLFADPSPLCKRVFQRCDAAFLSHHPECCAGTTALVCVVGTSRVVVANAGDSKAVLCRNGAAVDLSQEHKPDREDERKRIEKAGGWITLEKELPLGHLGNRAMLRHKSVREGVEHNLGFVTVARVNGELGVSRALGDRLLKPPKAKANLVVCDPDCCVLDIEDGDEFVVLGSDGLWDVLTSQEAVDCVRRCRRDIRSPHELCTYLVQEALDRGSLDNVCAAVVFLD